MLERISAITVGNRFSHTSLRLFISYPSIWQPTSLPPTKTYTTPDTSNPPENLLKAKPVLLLPPNVMPATSEPGKHENTALRGLVLAAVI